MFAAATPYALPLVTSWLPVDAGSWRVHFVRHAPGGSETLLASSEPFDTSAGDEVIVALQSDGAGYRADVIRE